MDVSEVKTQGMSELAIIETRKAELAKHPKIAPWIKALDKYCRKNFGRPMTVLERNNTAQCMHNALLINETTQMGSIEFVAMQMPVIASLLPTLVINELATTQALDKRIGMVAYQNWTFANAKGQVAAGTDMLTAKTGVARSKSARHYAMARTVRESIGTGSGTFTSVVDYAPIGVSGATINNLSTVIIESLVTSDSTETYTTIGTTNSSGTISGDHVSGTIAVDGSYTVTVEGIDSSADILITYDYSYDMPVNDAGTRIGVPRANMNIKLESVTAEDFVLAGDWSLGAQVDVMKAYGMDLESENVKTWGGMVQFTIDQRGLDIVEDAALSGGAATAATMWDARPSEGEAWVWKYNEFRDRVLEGSYNIKQKTLRAEANVMVCDFNVARVLRQMGKEFFAPSASLHTAPHTGPKVIGTFMDSVKVIENPFMTSNSYTLGWKGDSFLNAGLIFAPYIPLFATPTLTTADLMSQKGFYASAGFKIVNAGMFCKGYIQNLAKGYTVGA